MDIIIDDGVHELALQLTILVNFYPALKSNGIYVIEDAEPRGSWQQQIAAKPEFESTVGDVLYFGVSAAGQIWS